MGHTVKPRGLVATLQEDALAAKADLCEKLGNDLHEALSQLAKAEKELARLKRELDQRDDALAVAQEGQVRADQGQNTQWTHSGFGGEATGFSTHAHSFPAAATGKAAGFSK